ncbi:MAG: hypothetical protein GY914_05090 [Prochlorococcus sp.]|nr:hypothetical protein [Prochlorococcus sp.]
MSDLDNMSETKDEALQPDQAVEAQSEESQSTPREGDHDSEYFFVEDEGDQSTPNEMTHDQKDAAWRQEREKRKRKNEQLKAEREEKERIQRELDELKQWRSQSERGSKPTIEGCDYDPDKYAESLEKWYSHQAPTTQTKPTEQPNQQEASDDIDEDNEYYVHTKSKEVRDKLPEFDKVTDSFRSQVRSVAGNNFNSYMNTVYQIARRRNIDIAKAEFALGKSPALFEKLKMARDNYDIEDVLKEASAKIQTRERKPIETTPTPDVRNSGPVGNHEKAVQKAREKWMETGSASDYQRYRSLKLNKPN